MRPVDAYSTGGWFRDPIVSTMFTTGDDAIRALAGILLHELVHATVLVKDQAVFNESVASFIGETLAADYLVARFGASSSEVVAYHAERARRRARGERMAAAYAELDALYRSGVSAEEKRRGKARITAALEGELGLTWCPNNADLQRYRTYHTGHEALAELLSACGRDWPRFLAVLKRTPRGLFPRPHWKQLDAVIRELRPRCAAGAEPGQRREG
jgi:predicted aminopeptidase